MWTDACLCCESQRHQRPHPMWHGFAGDKVTLACRREVPVPGISHFCAIVGTFAIRVFPDRNWIYTSYKQGYIR